MFDKIKFNSSDVGSLSDPGLMSGPMIHYNKYMTTRSNEEKELSEEKRIFQ